MKDKDQKNIKKNKKWSAAYLDYLPYQVAAMGITLLIISAAIAFTIAHFSGLLAMATPGMAVAGMITATYAIVIGILKSIIMISDRMKSDKDKFERENDAVTELKEKVKENKGARSLLQLLEKLEKEAPKVKFDKKGAAKDSAANDKVHVLHNFEYEKLKKAAACKGDKAKLAELVDEVKKDAKKLKAKK